MAKERKSQSYKGQTDGLRSWQMYGTSGGNFKPLTHGTGPQTLENTNLNKRRPTGALTVHPNKLVVLYLSHKAPSTPNPTPAATGKEVVLPPGEHGRGVR